MLSKPCRKLGVIPVRLEIAHVRYQEGGADFQSQKLQKAHRGENMALGGTLSNSVPLETGGEKKEAEVKRVGKGQVSRPRLNFTEWKELERL